jgi:hypothetical protein
MVRNFKDFEIPSKSNQTGVEVSVRKGTPGEIKPPAGVPAVSSEWRNIRKVKTRTFKTQDAAAKIVPIRSLPATRGKLEKSTSECYCVI